MAINKIMLLGKLVKKTDDNHFLLYTNHGIYDVNKDQNGMFYFPKPRFNEND